MSCRPSSPLLALSCAAAIGLVSSSSSAEGGGDGLKPGIKAPQFMLPVVHGAQAGAKRWGPRKWVGEGAEAPKKLVVLSFFATYCLPCKKEMPELVRLFEKYQDQGLGVMLVSIDKGKDDQGNPLSDVVVKLAQENAVPFPVMHDRFQVVARRYEAERLPYMLMLGGDGVIRRVHVGYTEEMKAGLEDEVRELLGLGPLPATEKVAGGVEEKAG